MRVVFGPVPAGAADRAPARRARRRYEAASRADGRAPPVLLLAALVLDFLSIHPFQDGNGRVARLLTTNELLRHGYGVVRYVTLEQRIFEPRRAITRRCRRASPTGTKGPTTVAVDRLPAAVLSDAYGDFEARVAAGTALVGATKEEQARDYILTQAPRSFRISQIVDALPDISQATIRNALDRLKLEGRLAVGRGRSARWTRMDEAARRAPDAELR